MQYESVFFSYFVIGASDLASATFWYYLFFLCYSVFLCYFAFPYYFVFPCSSAFSGYCLSVQFCIFLLLSLHAVLHFHVLFFRAVLYHHIILSFRAVLLCHDKVSGCRTIWPWKFCHVLAGTQSRTLIDLPKEYRNVRKNHFRHLYCGAPFHCWAGFFS